jgi:hypothetical protein
MIDRRFPPPWFVDLLAKHPPRVLDPHFISDAGP